MRCFIVRPKIVQVSRYDKAAFMVKQSLSRAGNCVYRARWPRPAALDRSPTERREPARGEFEPSGQRLPKLVLVEHREQAGSSPGAAARRFAARRESATISDAVRGGSRTSAVIIPACGFSSRNAAADARYGR